MSKKVITPRAILSYPFLFEPQKEEDGTPGKYSAAFLFMTEDGIEALNELVLETAKGKWGDKAADMLIKGKLRHPIRRDTEDRGFPDGVVAFFNARSKTAPGVVSKYPGPDGKPIRITDPKDIYPGCIVRASVSAFAYDRDGNKGIGLGLNNVQKLEDGERIDGRRKAEDEFEADLTAKPADLSELGL